MNDIINSMGIILITAGAFLAFLVCLAVPPKITKKIISKLVFLVAVGGLVIYGYGFAQREDLEPGVAVLRATFDALRIFVGSNDWGEVSGAFSTPIKQVFFWAIHLIAFFTSASAVLIALGSGLLRRFRIWIFRIQDISVIYGLTEDTLDFGKELASKGAHAILFIDKNPIADLVGPVNHMGAILRSDDEALKADIRFLKSIGMRQGKRKIWIYTLDSDHASNQQYAKRLLCAMEKRKISPEQSRLTILGPSDETENRFLARQGQYGFGSVIAINEAEMVARVLIKHYPPCNVVKFNGHGVAENPFNSLIIGFGRIGQEVMRHLVMNGQFCGKNLSPNEFKIAVFSPQYEQRMGCLAHECDEMLDYYCIKFYPHDGRSCQMYDYIKKNQGTLNYIAVCTGNPSMNLQIAEQLRSFLKRLNCDVPIHMCSSREVALYVGNDRVISHNIYSTDILCSDQIDQMAMVLNHWYSGGGDMSENWRNCSYFDRVSSRAAADYYPAFLRMAGVSAEEVKKRWSPSGDLLENLAAAEHLRWNAFHYSMGFKPMTEAEFEERSAVYRKMMEVDSKATYSIRKDMDQRIHACIIPWNKLDAYSAKENAVTGKNANYAENDRKNIRALGEVLKARDKIMQ